MNYKVYVLGRWKKDFKTAAEAMAYIEKNVKPFRQSWKILEPNGKVFAQS